MTEADIEPRMHVLDPGAADALQAMEELGVAYDPTQQIVDLTREEKRRTTALMMAIQAYHNIIIKDAEYLKEAHNMARSGNGPVIRPATMDAMVEAAIKFDMFIAGRLALSRRKPENPAEEENADASNG